MRRAGARIEGQRIDFERRASRHAQFAHPGVALSIQQEAQHATHVTRNFGQLYAHEKPCQNPAVDDAGAGFFRSKSEISLRPVGSDTNARKVGRPSAKALRTEALRIREISQHRCTVAAYLSLR